MAVEGVSGSCSEVNMFIHDSSGDDESYITHINETYFHTKFKIDPHDLYTFHDSDVIAGEITVRDTDDDDFIFSDADVKPKLHDSPNKETDLVETRKNGEIKEEKEEVIPNGHYTPIRKPNAANNQTGNKDNKTNTKVVKTKSQSQVTKEATQTNVTEVRRPSAHSPKAGSSTAASKISITSVNTNSVPSNAKGNSTPSKSGGETFLDVFKREQGLVESPPAVVKIESPGPSVAAAPPPKLPAPVAKKAQSGNF